MKGDLDKVIDYIISNVKSLDIDFNFYIYLFPGLVLELTNGAIKKCNITMTSHSSLINDIAKTIVSCAIDDLRSNGIQIDDSVIKPASKKLLHVAQFKKEIQNIVKYIKNRNNRAEFVKKFVLKKINNLPFLLHKNKQILYKFVDEVLPLIEMSEKFKSNPSVIKGDRFYLVWRDNMTIVIVDNEKARNIYSEDLNGDITFSSDDIQLLNSNEVIQLIEQFLAGSIEFIFKKFKYDYAGSIL